MASHFKIHCVASLDLTDSGYIHVWVNLLPSSLSLLIMGQEFCGSEYAQSDAGSGDKAVSSSATSSGDRAGAVDHGNFVNLVWEKL